MYIMGKKFPDAGEPQKRTKWQPAPVTQKYHYRKGYNVEVVVGANYKEALDECNKFFAEVQAQYPTFEVISVVPTVFNYVNYTITFKI